MTTEAEFSPEDSPSVRVEGKLENEYTVSVKAPGKSPRYLQGLGIMPGKRLTLAFFYLSVFIQQLSKVSA